MRHVVSFSTGIPSAIVAYLITQRYPDALVVFADTLWEDDDNYRFYRDIESLINKPIISLTGGRNPLEIAEDTGYAFIPNHRTASCTRTAKIKLLKEFMEEKDILYIGMTFEDKLKGRLESPIRNWDKVGVTVKYPLIEDNIDPFGLAKELGLDPPRMYSLGYSHANCGGRCVKQGAGSWTRTLIHFKDRFDECEQWERKQIQRQATRILVEMTLIVSLNPAMLLFVNTSKIHTFLHRQIDGVKYPYSLTELRKEYENTHKNPNFFDLIDELNGYGCTIECGVGSEEDLTIEFN